MQLMFQVFLEVVYIYRNTNETVISFVLCNVSTTDYIYQQLNLWIRRSILYLCY